MQVEANGNSVYYELSGLVGAPVVMLSQSLACSSAMWRPQIPVLQGNYRVLAYDTRGHGQSGAPAGEYSFDLLGDDAVALMDALDIDSVHWVGLSMGGMIGQNLALRAPERIRSLTLCDTSSRIPPDMEPLWQERIETARRKGMAALVNSTIERWFTEPYRAKNPPELDVVRQLILATPPEGYIGCCHAIRRLDYSARLSEIDKPTLVIVGEQDPATPVAAAEAIQAGIPGAKLVVIPDASHLSNVEQPEAFNAAVTEFLAGVAG
ncbi:MAG TPA: 3-oxoadipate enol-lactonase [Alphaproteobacteria bacterium]|nr:3-oxoadipate enol-lactonase [Alphaproteobacteria bacterium]